MTETTVSSSSNDEPLINAQPCPRDRFLFTYLSLLHDVVTLREDMRRSFEEGFIQLAKSKSLIGSASLEFDQLRTESSDSAVTYEVGNTDDENSNEDLPESSNLVSLLPKVDQNELRLVLKRVCVLAPSPLRTAQSSFRRCTELAADLHNVYTRLGCVANAFRNQPCNCDHELCQSLKVES